jgi:hypothetical protein
MAGRSKTTVKNANGSLLGKCAIEDCDFNVLALGLCKFHYGMRCEAERIDREKKEQEQRNREAEAKGRMIVRDGQMVLASGTCAINADENILKQLNRLGALQCTVQETADVLLCSYDALRRLFERDPAAADAFYGARAGGKVSLRRRQFMQSKTSAAMAIWLGKQYLGQRDHMELAQFKGDGMTDELGAESPTALLRAVRDERE